MTAPVDVLAVLREMQALVEGEGGSDLSGGMIARGQEAIDAVAELIAAAEAALHYMRLHKYADRAWADDLAAALARCGGAP